MSNHVLLKRLQILTDKLELRRDDIAVGEAALADESRELASRQEQLSTVNEQVASAVREMDQLGVEGRAEKARRDEFSHEEEALRHTFTTILDQGIKGLREERKRQLAAAVAAEAAETELREVSVLFEDEEAVFRITDATYTFDELTSDACRFFELHPLDVVIMDDHDEPWPDDASVRGQMSQFDNAYGRIVLKFRQTEMEDERPEDADNLLQLLLNTEEEADDEDDEDELIDPRLQVVGHGGQDKKKKKKKKLNTGQLYREMPGFLFFTMIFIISLFGRRLTTSGYYQVNAIRTILVDEAFGNYNEKTYTDIRNFEEVWDWVENVLVASLYPDAKYNGDPFQKREVGTVMTYNRIVGAIRMRTVRSKPDVGCPGATAKLNRRLVMNQTGAIYDELFVNECHGQMKYDSGNEETRPYGPGIDLIAAHGSCENIPAPPPPPSVFLDVYGVPPTEDDLAAMSIRKLCRAFTFSPDVSTDGSFSTNETRKRGELGEYLGGGYVRDVDNPIDCRQRPEDDPDPNPNGVCERGDEGRNDLLNAVDQLKNNRWLDEATRAMFIKVTFYNGNLGFFMVINFIFEFSRGGVVYPETEMSVVNQEMFKTDTPYQLMITIIEFTTYTFVVYYTFVQLRLMYRSLRDTGSLASYGSDVWNLLECVVLVAFYTSTTLRIMLLTTIKPDPVIFENSFDDFSPLGRLYLETFNFDSLCVIALFFKMLKYAQLNLSMSMLWSVLTRSAKDVLFFTIMLFTFLTGFSMMSLQFFGTTINGYSRISSSVLELLLVLLGQFDVQGMQQASPFGVPFFFIYIVVMFLIMMNIFLAILGEAYTVVRSENDEIKAERAPTKRRGMLGWCRLIRDVIKGKLRQRRARIAANKGIENRRSAELPDMSILEGNGVEMLPAPKANGHANGDRGKTVTFSS